MADIYNIDVKDSASRNISMSEFAGKTLLIVNVASKCGLTPQYEGLQKLYDDYKDRDFVVLGFPCNQFGSQEPGSNEQIKTYCDDQYNISFKLFDKVDVIGEHASPLFNYLNKEAGRDIKWNFTKFLINNNGKIVERFSPRVEPRYIRKEIEKVL